MSATNSQAPIPTLNEMNEGTACLGWKLLGVATVAVGVHLARRWHGGRAQACPPAPAEAARDADEPSAAREPLLPADERRQQPAAAASPSSVSSLEKNQLAVETPSPVESPDKGAASPGEPGPPHVVASPPPHVDAPPPTIPLFSHFAPPPTAFAASAPDGLGPAAAWDAAAEEPAARGFDSLAASAGPSSEGRPPAAQLPSSPLLPDGGALPPTAAQALLSASIPEPASPSPELPNPFAAAQFDPAAAADHDDGWDAIPRTGFGGGVTMQRSATLRSSASERRLPRVEEDGGGARPPADAGARLAIKLDVIAGPCSETSFVTADDTLRFCVGRAPDCALVLPDGEVSGRHLEVAWSAAARCWQVADLGSLNGTRLNGDPVGGGARLRGRDYRLSTDDVLQLGAVSRLKVSVFPRELLPENRSSGERCGSLPAGSLPRSLTMPKHRIPSFTSLLSPKINSSPTKGAAVVAAASEELRLECCIASRTGRDHARKGQHCEDVACAECPLRGSEAALAGGSPAALFCVFDGHCGRGAADAASAALPDEVAARLGGAAGALGAGAGAAGMLRDAFLATDARIASEEGCTATAVLAWRGADGAVRLQAANVGDSSCLLIDPADGSWREMTEDHRLTNPRERERLASMGLPLSGTTNRLYGLNLARALGDRFLKDEDLGLSAEPSVGAPLRLDPGRGALLLVASDGLWDVADFDRVAAVAAGADREHGGSVVAVAGAVVAAAKAAGTRDDVTALVVRLWPEGEWEGRDPGDPGGRGGSFEQQRLGPGGW